MSKYGKEFEVEFGIKHTEKTIPLNMFEHNDIRTVEMFIPPVHWWSDHFVFEAIFKATESIEDDEGYGYNATLEVIPGTMVNLSNKSLLARFLRWAYHQWTKVVSHAPD